MPGVVLEDAQSAWGWGGASLQKEQKVKSSRAEMAWQVQGAVGRPAGLREQMEVWGEGGQETEQG